MTNNLHHVLAPFEYTNIDSARWAIKTAYSLSGMISQGLDDECMRNLNSRIRIELRIWYSDDLWTEERRLEHNKKHKNPIPSVQSLESISPRTLTLIDDAYIKHVQPYKAHLGTDEEDYVLAMKLYREAVVEILTTAAGHILNIPAKEQTEGQLSASMAPARAYVLLSYVKGHLHPLPFPTTSVIDDVRESLEPFQDAIAEVGKIC